MGAGSEECNGVYTKREEDGLLKSLVLSLPVAKRSFCGDIFHVISVQLISRFFENILEFGDGSKRIPTVNSASITHTFDHNSMHRCIMLGGGPRL